MDVQMWHTGANVPSLVLMWHPCCKCDTPDANLTPLMQIWHQWCIHTVRGITCKNEAPLLQIWYRWCKCATTGASVPPMVHMSHHFCKKGTTGKNFIPMVHMCHAGANVPCTLVNCDTYGKIATPEVLPAKLWNLPTICSFIEGV